MIIISGANGQLGRAIVEGLLQRVPATQVGVSVRDPEKALDLARKGVRVRRGDYDDADSLSQAFEGATQVLIVSSSSGGDQAVRQHRTAVDVAASVGAQRVLYTSHVGASSESPFGPMPDHAATEEALQASGVPYTVLRNGFYASTVPLMLGQALVTGEIALPADGPVSWTTHADLAEAAATLLASGPAGESRTINLTGSQAFDFQAVATLATEILGRRIVRTVISDEVFVQAMVARGLPAARAQMSLGIFLASRKGQFGLVDPALGELLKRSPVPLKEFLKVVLSPPR